MWFNVAIRGQSRQAPTTPLNHPIILKNAGLCCCWDVVGVNAANDSEIGMSWWFSVLVMRDERKPTSYMDSKKLSLQSSGVYKSSSDDDSTDYGGLSSRFLTRCYIPVVCVLVNYLSYATYKC